VEERTFLQDIYDFWNRDLEGVSEGLLKKYFVDGGGTVTPSWVLRKWINPPSVCSDGT
jgi:hypothetical protein